MPQLRCKFQVSTFSRFKVIAFFIFVYEFVKYAGKNIRTFDAKRRGSTKKKIRNHHNSNLRAETAFPGASKLETFILLLQLVFELEQFKLLIGISVFGPETHVT